MTMTLPRQHAVHPMRSRLPAAIASALMLMVLPAGALAQQASGSQDEQARVLDQVVVTANKREQDIRDVAAAVSVIGERTLENTGAVKLADYADFVPGLQVQTSGTPGLTTVSMRGIAAISSAATVATYVDEVPVGSSGLYQSANLLNLDLLPYDIQRVEVLRGPQGTLYGAGAIGGLLKYVTREPSLSGEEVRVGVGMTAAHDGGVGWNSRAAISVPLQDERIGLRMSLSRNELPGYITNVQDGSRKIDEAEQWGARAAVQFKGDSTDVNAAVLWQRIDSDNRLRMMLDPLTLQPMHGDLEDRLWQPQPFHKDFTLASLSIHRDLGWGNFVSATGWSQTSTLIQLDSTPQFGSVANLMLGLPEPGSSTMRYQHDLDKFTQELRLASNGEGRFDWMVGVFHTREKGMQAQHAWLGQLDGSPLPAPLDAMFSTLAVIEMPSTYKETAVFANAGWQISERFKLEAGVRQSRNDQEFSQDVPEGILAPIGSVPGASDEDVFTWSLSPQFTISDDTMAYLRVATGYQSGGPNVALPGIPPSVDSSMLTSYEVGLKSAFLDRRVQLDMSIYRIDWDDIQIGVSYGGIGGLANGGVASSEGIELAAMFRLIPRLQLGLNAAYTKARVKDDFQSTVIPQPGFDVVLNTGLAGDRLPYIPKLAWSGTAEYGFSVGGMSGHVGAALRFVGDRLSGTTQRQRVTAPGDQSTVLQENITPPMRLESYHSFDLYAGFGSGPWEFRAYVNNVADKRAWSMLSSISNALTNERVHVGAVPIQPRTYGVAVDFRF